MKKTFVTILSVILSVFALAFAGCARNNPLPEKTAVVYGLVHNYYLGAATITADKDSRVKEVTIDEYFLPNAWAITGKDPEAVGYMVGDYAVAFGVNNVGTAGSFKHPAGDVAIPSQLGDRHFGKPLYGAYYVNALKNNRCFTLKLGTASDYDVASGAVYYKKSMNAVAILTNTYGAINKSDPACTYWANNISETQLGFKKNLEEMLKYVKSDAFRNLNVVTAERLVDPSKANLDVWKIGDVTTGATLTDFKDYIKLCEDAYIMAVAAQH